MQTKLIKFITTRKHGTPANPANPAKDGGMLDLYGWTMEELKSHCSPEEWEDIKDKPEILTCVAKNLREYPFLFCGAPASSDGPAK